MIFICTFISTHFMYIQNKKYLRQVYISCSSSFPYIYKSFTKYSIPIQPWWTNSVFQDPQLSQNRIRQYHKIGCMPRSRFVGWVGEFSFSSPQPHKWKGIQNAYTLRTQLSSFPCNSKLSLHMSRKKKTAHKISLGQKRTNLRFWNKYCHMGPRCLRKLNCCHSRNS